jgi:hypothetical protein
MGQAGGQRGRYLPPLAFMRTIRISDQYVFLRIASATCGRYYNGIFRALNLCVESLL